MRPGLKIRIERVKQDKKVYELAKEVGISREYLRLIEVGKAKNPSREIMKKIAKSLDADVKELFFED